MKSTLRWGRRPTILTALEDVTQTSERAFVSVVELT